MVEIELKFKITDRQTFEALRTAGQFVLYSASEPTIHQIEDVYLDTADRQLYVAGYACRLRHQEGQWSAFLKEFGEAVDALHQREEFAIALPSFEPNPVAWPESDVRSKILAIIDDHPIQPLFTLRQKRTVRELRDGERLVAEWSLDEVEVYFPDRAKCYKTYLELEIEAREKGTEEDLRRLSGWLLREWQLEPERRSKFHRAFDLLSRRANSRRTTITGNGNHLRLEDRQLLERIVQEGPPLQAKRARLLLGWDAGANVRQLQSALGYSRSSVYYWLNAYTHKGMAIFSGRLLSRLRVRSSEEAGPASSPSPCCSTSRARAASSPNDPGALPESRPKSTALTMPDINELCQRYHVDMSHARHVACLALELFDCTTEHHRLALASRELLEKAALLHNLGLETDAAHHHTVGAEILSETPIVELTDEDRQIVSAIVFLHRKAATVKRLESRWITAVPDLRRAEMLTLAALVRVADGLDYSQTQTTQIERIEETGNAIEVTVSGLHAAGDAARANAKADLWDYLYSPPLHFVARRGETDLPIPMLAESAGLPDQKPGELETSIPKRSAMERLSELKLALRSEVEALRPVTSDDTPGISLDEPAGEAARKLIRFHFVRMLEREPGVRYGEDIEEVHHMRVAVRRMRSAVRLFGRFFTHEIRPFSKGLQRTAQILGEVRDLDVLLDHARHYAESLSEIQREGLTPLLTAWSAEREAAHARLIEYLDSERYARFVADFTVFLLQSAAGLRPFDPARPRPHLVRHVVPRLVYAAFERVRAYDLALNFPTLPLLHMLRIDGKRLRYTLEFFREVLGPESAFVIQEVIALQDYLGSLHDADVADMLIRDFLNGGTGWPRGEKWERPKEARQRVVAPGVVQYLAVRQAHLQELLVGFPAVWARLNRPEVRQALAAAVSTL